MYKGRECSCFAEYEIFEEETADSEPLLQNEVGLEDVCRTCALPNLKSSENLPQKKDNLILSNNLENRTEYSKENIELDNEENDSNEESHCHITVPNNKYSQESRQLLMIMILSVFFMIAEIVGGHIAGSLSVMTDAVHLMSDVAGFLLSYFAVWFREKSATRRFTFGFYRTEILCSLLSVCFIWFITGIFIYLATYRLWSGEYDIEAGTMLLVGGLGIVINIIMTFVLHGTCTGIKSVHGHTHSTGSSSINIRAAFAHILGDLMQSVGVFISALVIYIFPAAKMADPLCTYIFSILVLITTHSVLTDTIKILMEGCPNSLDYISILKTLIKIDGVLSVHDLHVWSLSIEKTALSAHLVVELSADRQKVLTTATSLIRQKYHIYTSAIQVEISSPEDLKNCLQCQPLSR